MNIILNGSIYATNDRITLHDLIHALNNKSNENNSNKYNENNDNESSKNNDDNAITPTIDTNNVRSNNFAIAVNFTIVPRSRYHEFWLNDGDKVEIVTAFQGG